MFGFWLGLVRFGFAGYIGLGLGRVRMGWARLGWVWLRCVGLYLALGLGYRLGFGLLLVRMP